MSGKTWIHSITRPASHLIGTVVVMANLLACAVIALTHPQWQPPLVLIATAPLVAWFTLLAWRHERVKAASRDRR